MHLEQKHSVDFERKNVYQFIVKRQVCNKLDLILSRSSYMKKYSK